MKYSSCRWSAKVCVKMTKTLWQGWLKFYYRNKVIYSWYRHVDQCRNSSRQPVLAVVFPTAVLAVLFPPTSILAVVFPPASVGCSLPASQYWQKSASQPVLALVFPLTSVGRSLPTPVLAGVFPPPVLAGRNTVAHWISHPRGQQHLLNIIAGPHGAPAAGNQFITCLSWQADIQLVAN